MSGAWRRFDGVAGAYDAVRPTPPTELVSVITSWAGTDRPDVVDLGTGTGLSAVIWAGRARQVIALEPAAGMRKIAQRRIDAAATATQTRFRLLDASAEDTRLPDASADVVTASQALHWFDPGRALPEIARVLRPGGVLAAYDCDWPPCVHWEVDAAIDRVTSRAVELENRRGLPPLHHGKEHLDRLRRSGLFRHCAEVCAHGRDEGDADRLIAVTFSYIGRLAELIDSGSTEHELGLTQLRKVAAARLSRPASWWWSYRMQLAIR